MCFANRFYNRFYAVLCGFLTFGPTVFWSSTPTGGGFGLPVFWSSTMVCTHKNWNSPLQALSAEVGGQHQLGVAFASLFFWWSTMCCTQKIGTSRTKALSAEVWGESHSWNSVWERAPHCSCCQIMRSLCEGGNPTPSFKHGEDTHVLVQRSRNTH